MFFVLLLSFLLSVLRDDDARTTGTHRDVQGSGATPGQALVRNGRHRQGGPSLGRALEAAAQRRAAAGESVQRGVSSVRVTKQKQKIEKIETSLVYRVIAEVHTIIAQKSRT